MEYFFQDVFQQLAPVGLILLFIVLLVWKYLIEPYYNFNEEEKQDE